MTIACNYLRYLFCLAFTKLHKFNYIAPSNVLDYQLYKLGSFINGWVVPTCLIKPGWICYCGGVGEDITFDAALVGLGCEVFAFDPTPKAIDHVAKNHPGDRFHFFGVALWSSNITKEFFVNSDSFLSSIVRSRQRCKSVCKSIPQLMKELGHQRIDLLKLDIEGAEYEVLKCVINRDSLPTILCIEFDQPAWPWRMHDCVSRLIAIGYKLVAVDNLNYTFVR